MPQALFLMASTDIPIADRAKRQLPQQEPIAIIGIGCRYSGDIRNLDDFWKMLAQKKSTLTDFPEDRFGGDHSIVDPDRGKRKIVSSKGGWLKQLKEFDAKFFKISPREAEKVDPHQRIMLEVTFEALEDAGLKLEDVWGSRTGVYAGMWSSDFEHILDHSKDDIDVYSTTGSGRYAAAGRLAYFFNLQGPTFTIDTACSTSLVAVHLAAQSLQLRETDLAVCSAANLILHPFISIGYSRSRLLSDYGKCRFGAVDASGYVRTEGAATVILKRLSDAIRDGDAIHAIVPGSACNSDGQSHKYMLAPSAITQEIMIKDALERARIAPSEVQYVEAHGTGTKAGDPAELASIPAALSEGRDAQDKFYVGSIKTNLGHTEAASGFAGMIKTILALQHRTIPANLYADEDKNPYIPWDKISLEIPAEAKPWPHPEKTLIAGVNSFGISGTNAHVLLQEVPTKDSTPDYNRNWKLFPLSGANEKTLQQYAKDYLSEIQQLNGDEELLNYTLNVAIRKADLQQRAVILFQNRAELEEGLRAIIDQKEHPNVLQGYFDEKKGTALVFPGQGAQWNGMGKQLYEQETSFRNAIDECELAFSKQVSWSLKEELFSPNGMQSIDIIQPALVAVEIALAKWWMDNGIVFQSVIGHSMGEVAAAYIGGKISLDEAALIICTRSKLMKETSGKGAMGYIALSPDDTQKRIEGQEHLLQIGVNNSPASCVVSGDPQALDALLTILDQEGVFCRKVKVDVASHSPQMDVLTDRLRDAVAEIAAKPSDTVFYSTVNASEAEDRSLDAAYWTSNLRNTVRFAETVQKMAAAGAGHFVEMSPHPTLLQAIGENADFVGVELNATGSMEREKDEVFTLLKNLAAYFCSGGRIVWRKFYGTAYTRIQLPAYPFERQHYWVEEGSLTQKTKAFSAPSGKHPFLMAKSVMPEDSPLHIWDTEISLAHFPYLVDHKIQETVVVPGAAYLEMLLAAAEELKGEGQHILKNVVLSRAMPLKDQDSVSVQVVLQHKIEDTYECSIYSWEGDEKDGIWVKNASATLELGTQTTRLLPNALPLDVIESFTDHTLSGEAHYENTSAISLPYGPAFQTVESIKIGENFILANVKAGKKIASGTERYLFHPAMLDGCIQAFLSAMYTDENKGTFVPVSVQKVQLHQYKKSITSVIAAIKITAESNDKITGNAVIYDEEGQVVLEMKGFSLDRLEQNQTEEDALRELLFEVVQQETSVPDESKKKILLFAPNHSDQMSAALAPEFLVKIADTYLRDGNTFYIQPENETHYQQLAAEVGSNIDTIVHAWGMSYEGLNAGLSQEDTVLSAVRIFKAFEEKGLTPRIWTLNLPLELYPSQSTLPGMLNVWRNEHPESKASSIEWTGKETQTLSRIIHSNTPECQWNICEGKITVSRLQHPKESIHQEAEVQLIPAENAVFEAVIDEPGILDNIKFQKKNLSSPASHEVQVAVKALGINFMNLMSALGIYPGKENGFATLGIECAGVVQAVGADISHLKVGDRVMGMAYHTMASHINVDASLMQPIPKDMSFEDAATIPVVYLTVYYSLVTLARLEKGERVLIHAATGGVGLAAIQLAQAVGAEIYATAGSQAKRDLLHEMGIKYVYDSRSTDFAARILQDTSEEGIDVVLNSLTGEAMLESLHLLRNFGRFVEIGKKDVYANSKLGLQDFAKGLSYFMVDFEKMIFEKPATVGKLLGEIIPYFESHTYQPLSKKIFPIAAAKTAFEYMSSGQHTGKIVIAVGPENVMLEERREILPPIDPQATYLLTGGYGGLGLTFAQYLVDKGARQLILTGRSGPKENALSIIQQLEERGVQVIIEQASVSSNEEISRIIAEIPENQPLKGVFHLAGLLEDASILNMTSGAFYRVLEPKVDGAFILHENTQHLPLDYFVLFSSSTKLFGSPGQAAYVAANSYMDALATYRHQHGLAALSIQWGTVSDVGLAAAAENRADRLAEEGVAPLSPDECLALFEDVLALGKPVMGAFRFDINKWQNTYPAAKTNPFFELIRSENVEKESAEQSDTELSFVQILQSIEDAEQRSSALEVKLKEKVGQVLKLNPEEINNKTPFKSLGIDSLMSIQLKNQLEKTFETSLSVTSFWTYANIRDYTRFLMEKLNLQSTVKIENPSSSVLIEVEKPIAISAPIETPLPDEDISLDELSKLLEDELNDL